LIHADVLNNMILPRDWHTDHNQHFMQYVSHHKTERDDIIRLKEALDQALEHRQARTEGICPIREELFSQSFDEIVRQVTINSPERGLLLMRVRDEHKMTLAAYQTLYQSSVSFGMRKLLEAEEGMDELELLLAEAQQIKDTLDSKKSELLSKKVSLEKSILERKKEESETREDQNMQI
jgi:dynein light intermediate chain